MTYLFLGTCHLAKRWMEHLRKTNPSKVSRQDIELVQIAALCHDLGHGPFGHTFELLAKKRNPDWSHEKASCLILKRINDKIDATCKLTELEIAVVQSLILNGKMTKEQKVRFTEF